MCETREIYQTLNDDEWFNWKRGKINGVILDPLYVDQIPNGTTPWRRAIGYSYRCDDPDHHASIKLRKTKLIILEVYVNDKLAETNIIVPYTNDPEFNYHNLQVYRSKEGLKCGPNLLVKCNSMDRLLLVNLCTN